MKSKLPFPDDQGYHNKNLNQTIARLEKARVYEDLSTVCCIPTRGVIPAKVCTALWNLQSPMNQPYFKFCVEGKEVGAAYNEAVNMILDNPVLSKWKYFLTAEEDNIPPPDGLLKLLESIKDYDGVGALYYTKGENGNCMGYGYPYEMPKNFRPIVPIPDKIIPVNGLGMGLSLFRISMFKELRKKGVSTFFKTVQEYQVNSGTKMMTQDLFFFELAGKEGFKFALDCRVKVGHLDPSTGVIW